jgi:DNA helicase-2/ATP-dependent DNA helicase PcrA
MEFSARRLKTFLECPRKFQFTYLDQIPVPTPSPLAFGKTIHEVIETIHLEGLWDEAKAFSLFRSLWEKRQREEPILFTDQPPEKYEKLAEKILSGYLRRQKELPPPLLVEFEFSVPFGETLLHGFIDQIREEREGLVIVDLKSDKSKPSRAELDMDLQFTLYAFAAHQIFHQPIKACVHYHLRTNEEILTYRDPERCAETIGEVLRFVTQNLKAGVFPPEPRDSVQVVSLRFPMREGPSLAKPSPFGRKLAPLERNKKEVNSYGFPRPSDFGDVR